MKSCFSNATILWSERENGYDLRIDIADCTDWEVVPNGIAKGREHSERPA